MIFKKDLIYKISKKASIALIIIQLISVLLLATQKKQEDFLNNSSQKIDFSQQFNFSKNKNIIILVIDSFQTDFFQEIINKDNSYKKMFNGFTYFRNAAGGFPATAFSTPLILTSKYYDNSQPKKIFLKKAFLSDSSISKILKKNGFLADIYPSNLFYYNNETISNYKEYNKTKNVKLLFNKDILFDYIQLFDITLFRICPHFFKKNIYANRSWFLKRILTLKKINRLLSKHNQENDFENNIINEKPNLFSENSLNDVNVKFIQEMHLKAAADYDKPAFKYYHLAGIHPPIYLDENLKHHYNALPATRESYITNAKGILKLTGIFIDILKRNKIYDNSMIFIIADHGTQHIPVDLKPIGFKETNTTSQIDTFNLGSGLPLILVKPFNSQTNFEISDAPVSLANIGATIFDALHITEAEQIEKSMFKIGKEDKIYRRFLHHNWGREEQNSDYMPKITEYTISGFSWLRSSWKLKKKK
ncbi:MAG: sulfatase-like hydrolase/transferase [Candidatus Omnitrophica bacterium]|nr:sulfatase-like hydrolase/transferase [Candidatus Omnitrophota bacterium]